MRRIVQLRQASAPGLCLACLLSLSFVLGSAVPAEADPSWTSLRGPQYDGSIPGRLFDGPDAGLEVGWKVALGSGYSGVLAADGVVYTLFAAGEQDALGAFDAETGEELWRYAFGPTYPGHDGSHDGPISTPVLEDGTLYGLGPWGHLFAVEAATGKALWTKHLSEDFGSAKPHYGYTVSPVLAEGTLVLALTRDEEPEEGAQLPATFVGLDPANGELRWKVGEERVDYQSPVVATLAGREQVLAASETHIHGIDPASGDVLWSYAFEGDNSAMGAGSLIPLPIEGDRIFLGIARNSSKMVQVSHDDGGWSVEELWSTNALARSYMQPIFHDGVIYGMNNRIFAAIDADSGERLWRSREPGDGTPTLVGNHIVVITKPGSLHVATPSTEGYQELAQIKLFDEHAWSPVAWEGGHLYARSMGHLARIDPSRQSAGAAENNPWLADTAFGLLLAKIESAPADQKQQVVDNYLEDRSFPLVEPSGAVHFLYQGAENDVGIVGDMIGFRREDPMTRVAGTDLFYWSTLLEPDAQLTYGFIPDYGGETVPDPKNPAAAGGLFGNTSLLTMPAFAAPAWAKASPEAKGAWEDLTFPGPGEGDETVDRKARVYLPAGYDPADVARYPSIYLLGAGEGIDLGELGSSLDSILGQSAEKVVVVVPLPAELENPRNGPSPEAEGEALLTSLIPKVDSTYRTKPQRSERAVVGFGDGGESAFYLAFTQGDTFGKLASHGATLLGITEIAEVIEAAPKKPLVIYQGWGTYHLRSPHEGWDMVEYNRELRSFLREQGYRPTGGEVPEGFGWACWKNNTESWLQALFPAV